MGRSPCCEKVGLKKGPWTPEEDQKLLAYIEEHGHGSWRALPAKAGLQRCGKSCRLRWTNYLRPDIKRGKFSLQEEQTIIQLHALLGNRWSAIATHLPKRTDNEIKNYWNTHLKKRLTKMGIDPVTHKPKTDALGSGSGNPKDAANLSHMAQWESARLEAEARLVRESKLLPTTTNNNHPPPPPHLLPTHHHHHHHHFIAKAGGSSSGAAPPPCLDVLKAWQGAWTKSTNNRESHNNNNAILSSMMAMDDLESPTSTLNFPDSSTTTTTNNNNNNINQTTVGGFGTHETALGSLEFGRTSSAGCDSDHIIMANNNNNNSNNVWNNNSNNNTISESNGSSELITMKEIKMMDGGAANNMINTMSLLQDVAAFACTDGGAWFLANNNINESSTSSHVVPVVSNNVMEGFCTDVFVYNSDGVVVVDEGQNSSVAGEDTNGGDGSCGASGFFEENKSYWNSILNLVNASPSGSPVF